MSQEIENNASAEQTQQATANTTNETQPVQETPEQINWKRFREQQKYEREQREIAQKVAAEEKARAEALKAAMDALLNKPAKNDYEQDEETQEAIIAKKVEEALRKKEAEFEKKREEEERRQTPTRLKQTYSDFESVCTAENLDYLEFHHPEIATAYKYMPDGFERWSSIYKAIKKLVPNSSDIKKDMAKIEKNMNKPQSMSVSGMSTVSDKPILKLDDKRMEDNWRRMQQIMKQV